VFEDRSHEYLHVLADDLMDGDRAAAARLLEAKQRVEAAFADPDSAEPEQTADLLRELQAALAEAATAAGLDPSSCGEEAA
jgi:non-homologous end joining protein Ku